MLKPTRSDIIRRMTAKWRMVATVVAVGLVAGTVLVGPAPTSAAPITVDCSAGDDLQAAIDGKESIVIEITGTCRGNFIIGALHGPTFLTLRGAGTAILDGEMKGPVLTIEHLWTVTIEGLTITNGVGSDDGGRLPRPAGGGIFNSGHLTVLGSTISNNRSAFPVQDGTGGGVFNDLTGTMTLNDSTVSDNYAAVGGAGIDNRGVLTLVGTKVTGNQVTYLIGGGGGISNGPGVVDLWKGTVVRHNSANEGGGIKAWGFGVVRLYSGSLVADNIAYSQGGGIHKSYGPVYVYKGAKVKHNTPDDIWEP